MDRRRFLHHGSALGAAWALGASGPAAAQGAPDEPTALDKVRNRGRLVVGLYNDMPPFHERGAGIDVQLAGALAAKLGVGVSLLPFPAGENMADDLRNMVWKGHYLGYGPADVLLHVPVDRPLMEANPQVEIFGPYWRESVVIARDLSKLPELESLQQLGKQPVAVPGITLAGWLLLGAESGLLRDQLITKMDSGVDAAQMLQRGEVAAACGLRSEINATLRGDPRFAVTPLPIPRAPRAGWAVGMAVKRSAKDLAQALQGGLNDLVAQGDLTKLFAAGGLEWQRV
ncbi:MAG: substrate-binding periplasmic protein [Leptothrix sp. (in: b-proteobacteria)]